MAWVYIQSETPSEAPPHGLFTVGHYAPDGTWHSDSDHNTREEAADRVAYLNGRASVNRTLDAALNSGDGSYRP